MATRTHVFSMSSAIYRRAISFYRNVCIEFQRIFDVDAVFMRVNSLRIHEFDHILGRRPDIAHDGDKPMRTTVKRQSRAGFLGAMGDRFRALTEDRRGNIALIGAIAAVPMILAAGVTIDYVRASSARADLQTAIDAAVLAGARDASAAWTTVATTTLDSTLSASSGAPTVKSRTFTKNAAGEYVGTVTATLPTSITQLMGLSSIDLGATATAVVKVASDNVCILLNDTSASPGLLLNSGATFNAPNCQVHVKSTGSPSATFNAGTTLSTKKICLAGSAVTDNGGSHPNLTKSCTTATDPFAGTLPTPASAVCSQTSMNVNGGTVTFYPGVYCGGVNLNNGPTVNFQPGVYVIKGGNINANGGKWTGSGVTFYFADTSYIQFNGSVTLNLTAPTSGTYADLLMYEANGLAKSSFSINATNGATLEGLIWLPSRNLTLNAGASVTSNKLTMVLNTLIANQVSWTLDSSNKTIAASGSAASGTYLKK
jgi:Flp pilus assembly protein TadG